MSEAPELDQLRSEVVQMRRHVSQLSGNLAAIAKVWSQFVENHGKEHSDILRTIAVLAEHLEELAARFPKSDKLQ